MLEANLFLQLNALINSQQPIEQATHGHWAVVMVTKFYICDQAGSLCQYMQTYKSLCPAAAIDGTLVNRQTDAIRQLQHDKLTSEVKNTKKTQKLNLR